jgi:hypothetical protein
MGGSFTSGAAIGLLACAANLFWADIAQAQVRDLDTESSAGKVYAGEYGGNGEAARFALTLGAGEGIQIEALPVAGSDPRISVFDSGTGELLAENDDQPGTVAARVRLFGEERRRLRIEVSASPGGPEAGPGTRFVLLVMPSDYRPSPPRDIAAGQRHAGELVAGDEQLFRVAATQGQAWEFALAAPAGSALDPFLQVLDASGEPLASDDDGGDGLNALLHFTAPRAAIYTVRASGLGSSAGSYVFNAAILGDMPPAEIEQLDFGRAVRGTLRGGGETRLYRLSPSARAAIASGLAAAAIEMTAADSELDPLVEVGFQTPLGFSAVRSDDDGGGGLNARLVLDFAEFAGEGDWLDRFRIRAHRAIGEGSYEIVVRALPDGAN